MKAKTHEKRNKDQQRAAAQRLNRIMKSQKATRQAVGKNYRFAGGLGVK